MVGAWVHGVKSTIVGQSPAEPPKHRRNAPVCVEGVSHFSDLGIKASTPLADSEQAGKSGFCFLGGEAQVVVPESLPRLLRAHFS